MKLDIFIEWTEEPFIVALEHDYVTTIASLRRTRSVIRHEAKIRRV